MYEDKYAYVLDDENDYLFILLIDIACNGISNFTNKKEVKVFIEYLDNLTLFINKYLREDIPKEMTDISEINTLKRTSLLLSFWSSDIENEDIPYLISIIFSIYKELNFLYENDNVKCENITSGQYFNFAHTNKESKEFLFLLLSTILGPECLILGDSPIKTIKYIDKAKACIYEEYGKNFTILCNKEDYSPLKANDQIHILIRFWNQSITPEEVKDLFCTLIYLRELIYNFHDMNEKDIQEFKMLKSAHYSGIDPKTVAEINLNPDRPLKESIDIFEAKKDLAIFKKTSHKLLILVNIVLCEHETILREEDVPEILNFIDAILFNIEEDGDYGYKFICESRNIKIKKRISRISHICALWRNEYILGDIEPAVSILLDISEQLFLNYDISNEKYNPKFYYQDLIEQGINTEIIGPIDINEKKPSKEGFDIIDNF